MFFPPVAWCRLVGWIVLVLAQGPALLEVAVRFVLARQQVRIGGLGPVEGGRAFHCISSVRPIPILPLAIAQSAAILAARAPTESIYRAKQLDKACKTARTG